MWRGIYINNVLSFEWHFNSKLEIKVIIRVNAYWLIVQNADVSVFDFLTYYDPHSLARYFWFSGIVSFNIKYQAGGLT